MYTTFRKLAIFRLQLSFPDTCCIIFILQFVGNVRSRTLTCFWK